MTLLNKALEVAEEYPVFPCDVRKRPVCSGGFKAATQDPAEIERLFSVHGAALIGVPTGELSGLSVIDIDVRDGKQGKEWVDANKELLGVTKVAETQSGGWHYYYQHADGIRNRAGIDGCVDVRGDGGYVIWPESIGYRWVNDEDFGTFPDALGSAVGHMVSSISSPNDGSDLDMWGNIVDGREKFMARMVYAAIANYYRDNGTYPTLEWMVVNVYPVYEKKVRSRGDDLNAEGRGIDEFKKKVTSTLNKARKESGAGLNTPPAKEAIEPKSASSFDRQIKIKTLDELRKTPPPSFLVGDYIIDKSLAVVFGAPASYKSFLVLDWALSVAHGSDWNGRPTVAGRCLYLAMEGQSGISVRAAAWHKDRVLSDADAPFYTVTQPLSMALDQSDDIRLLVEAIDAMGEAPSLIIVDTLARSFAGGADENSATDMGTFIRNLDLIRERYDCTVVVVHHTGKSGDIRGSSALMGAVDTAISIKRETGTNQVCVRVDKQKDVEECEPIYLQAREVSFVSGVIGSERTSIVLDVTDRAQPRGKGVQSEVKLFALEVLRECLKDTNLTETKGDDFGVPEDVFKAVLKAKYQEQNHKPLHGTQVTRVTKDWSTGEGALFTYNNGLVNERW